MPKFTHLKDKLEDESKACIESYHKNDAADKTDTQVAVTDVPFSRVFQEQADISYSNDEDNLSENVAGKPLGENQTVTSNDALFQAMQQRLTYLEDRFSDMQKIMEDTLLQNSDSLKVIKEDLSSTASNRDLSRLRKEFDLLHKKLGRLAREEDALSGRSLNAAKIPPDVLQITYSKTLNDLYGAMLDIYGDSEAEATVNSIRDNVRGFSAGVDFFRFENGTFVVKELSEAIQSRLVSTKQIHGTYIEIFKRIAEYVPNYESPDFRSFVETGSREYAVEKIAEHTGRFKELESLVNQYLQELNTVSENMGFVAQLQNQQLEDIKNRSEDISNIKDQISNLSHAVNLHTRLFKKLNSNLEAIRSQFEFIEFNSQNKAMSQEVISISSEISQAIPSQPELAALAASLTDLREQTSLMVSELCSRVDSVFSDVQSIETVSREVASLQEQLQKLCSDMQEDVMCINLDDIEGVNIHAEETDFFESDLCIDLNDLNSFTDVVIKTLVGVGPSTLKQLHKVLDSSEVKLDEEELMQVLDKAIASGLIASNKKGRHLYYSVSKGQ